MSTKGNLTREEAVAIIGEEAVAAAERENCEPTGRVGYNGKCQGDDLIEWSSSAAGLDRDGNECSVRVYLYTNRAEEDAAEEFGWDAIRWRIAGYEIG